jgi:hypothetical protein
MNIPSSRRNLSVVLSGAKDLTQAAPTRLGERGAPGSVGEVLHFVRDDSRPTRRDVLFITC